MKNLRNPNVFLSNTVRLYFNKKQFHIEANVPGVVYEYYKYFNKLNYKCKISKHNQASILVIQFKNISLKLK